MERLLNAFGKIIPVAALIFILFIGGVVLGRANLFPSRYVDDAFLGLVSLVRWAELYLPFSRHQDPHQISIPKPNDVGRASGTNDRALTAISHLGDDGFQVSVIDRAGNILHEWKTPQDAFDSIIAQSPSIAAAEMLRPAVRAIHGIAVQQDGSLIYNFADVAMIKLDRCSNTVWTKAFTAHHDLGVEDDGTIVSLGQNLSQDPVANLPRMNAPFLMDTVAEYDQDGNLLRERNMLEAHYNGRSLGGILIGNGNMPQSTGIDITHMNDAEIISAEFASHYDFVNAGDLMVSYRNVNMLAIIDRETWAVKWSMQGPFLYQHDPDALPDGTISVYDNRTSHSQWNQPRWLKDGGIFGSSRIVRLDPMTQQIVWEFEGSKEQPFYSTVQGRHEWVSNHEVLVVEPEAGRIFEVDARTNKITWQYWNIISETDEATITGRVIAAQRLDAQTSAFMDQPACVSK